MRAPDPVRREGRLANVAGAVLLGGASSRMGSDKAHCELEGQAFATRVASLLDRLFTEVLLVGGTAPAAAPGRPVADVEGPQCALRGLVSALAAASAERVLVVATDMPVVSPELLLALVAWPDADAVVPRDGEQMHPMCALYRREPVLDVARARLEAGELRLRGVLDRVETQYIEAADLMALDPEALALSNVNTPAELAALEARITAGGQAGPARDPRR